VALIAIGVAVVQFRTRQRSRRAILTDREVTS